MVITASRRVAMAAVCACRRPDASVRAAAFRSAAPTLPSGPDNRTTEPAAMITRTTTISRRVNPLSRFMARDARTRSVGDVAVLALAAVPAVGAERDEVVWLALAGHREAVIVAP